MKKQQMIERRESLVPFAQQAGIIVPDGNLGWLDQNGFDPSSELFPHWSLYCIIQIERPISSEDAPLHNAKVVATIPLDRLKLWCCKKGSSPTEPFKIEEIVDQLK